MQGAHVIPAAKRILKLLEGDNPWKRYFAYTFELYSAQPCFHLVDFPIYW